MTTTTTTSSHQLSYSHTHKQDQQPHIKTKITKSVTPLHLDPMKINFGPRGPRSEDQHRARAGRREEGRDWSC
jgi:hypothetical protein